MLDTLEKWECSTRWVKHFTQGQCHALALEMHWRTGYDLWAVMTDTYEDVEIDGGFGHVLVRCPSGVFYDINGRSETEEELRWTWDEMTFPHLYQIDEDWLASWDAPIFEEAEVWAKRLIDHFQLDKAGIFYRMKS